MKRIVIIMLLGLLASNCFSQNELTFSYSPFSVYAMHKYIDHIQGTGYDDHFVLGAMNIDYYRHLNDWLKVGVNVIYDHERIKHFGPVFDGIYYEPVDYAQYSYSRSAFALMPQIEFEYLRHPKFKLGSGLSVGFANETYKASSTYMPETEGIDSGITFHINLLSFRWGQKQGLYGSLGLGVKGLAGLGYFVRF